MTVRNNLKKTTLLLLFVFGVFLVLYGVVSVLVFDTPLFQKKWSHEKESVGLHIVVGAVVAVWSWVELTFIEPKGP